MAYPAKLNRRLILDAALKVLAKQGLAGMSLRSVAAALHVVPNAVYHHFDLEHLRTAVASEVAVLVNAALSQALSPEQSPEEAIWALIRSYMKFAKEQHFLYEALLVPRPASGEDAIGPRQLWLFYIEQIGRVSGPERAPEAAVALWAFMHGMVALQSVDAFNEEKPFTSLDFGIHAWMQSASSKKPSARKPTEPAAVVSKIAAGKRKGGKR